MSSNKKLKFEMIFFGSIRSCVVDPGCLTRIQGKKAQDPQQRI